MGKGQGEEFNAQRVENLKEQIIGDLVNAKNIRNLKPDDYVTVVILGGGARNSAVRGAGLQPRALRARGAGATADVASNGDAGAQSTMTLRAKKSAIDAFAKEKLEASQGASSKTLETMVEDFRKKVSVQVY